MASRRQCLLLTDLPMEVLIIIASDVAVTSYKPMEDLGNLRAFCRVMEFACGDPSVGQHVAMLRIYMEGFKWLNPDRYYNLLALMVGVANPQACTLKGIADFFTGTNPSLNEVSCAAAGGHNVGAYLYALMLYMNNAGAADDDIAKMYIHRLECKDDSVAIGSAGPKKLRNNGCQVCREEATYLVNSVTWHMHGEPLPPAPVRGDFPCAQGDCGKVKGREQATQFCNEDSRIHHEIVEFKKRMGIDQ
uniref:F-box domain-containing protein n=1 Tax=Setaria italica TaxID=4555 RepID=K4AKT7_SETIT